MIYVYGSDERVVKAARVSNNIDNKDFSVDRDRKLISYLYANKHYSPFEHVILFHKVDKSKYFELIEKINDPSILLYYDFSKNILVQSSRTFLSIYEYYKHLLSENDHSELQEKIPTLLSLVEKHSKSNNYRKDYNIIYSESSCESGSVTLVDRTFVDFKLDYFSFIIECPIFVARQWMRHRFGSFNEVSRRYTSDNIKFYFPEVLRTQSQSNKQASIDKEVVNNSELLSEIKLHVSKSEELYNKLIENNVAREHSRMVLPQNLMTRFYWTVPRVSLDNFIELRCHEHAQKEIRSLACLIKNIVYKNQ